jgi:hypothetical protein
MRHDVLPEAEHGALLDWAMTNEAALELSRVATRRGRRE